MTMPFTPCDPSATKCEDVSVGILTKIYGDVIQQLAAGADPSTVSASANVIASIMQYFNSGIFVVAGIILSYIVTVGVANTANDGEAFGKSWSSVWTPVRAVSGLAALIPSASGYAYIQIFVLSLTLWAVGFANGIFKIGVENGIVGGTLSGISSELGTGSAAKPNPKYPLYDLRQFASDYLAIAWCQKAVTGIYGANLSTGTAQPVISISSDGNADSVQEESTDKRSRLYLYKDRNADSNLAGGYAICGSIKLYEYSAPGAVSVVPDAGSAFSAATITDNSKAMMAIRVAALKSKQQAASDMMKAIDEWVADWPADLDVPDGQTPTWDSVKSDTFNQIVNTAQSAMTTELVAQINNDTVLKKILDKYTSDITKDGWAMAGGFYQRLGGLREEMAQIFSEVIYDATKPDLSTLPSDTIGAHTKLTYSAVYGQVISKSLTGASYSGGSLQSDMAGFSSMFTSNITGLSVDSLGNRGSGMLNSVVGNVMQSSIDKLVGTDGHVDMIARIKTLGDSLKVAEVTLNTAINVVNLTFGAGEITATIADSVSVFGNKVNTQPIVAAVRSLFNEIFAKHIVEMATWLGRLAFWFGIFIPTLPYFIFMMAVVGWLLSVLQALVTAPLWAVMHMTPERSFIGGQQQGYLLLLSLFARPALIVIGLFAAMAVANPIIQYVSIFFFAVRNANVTSSESLGWFMQFLTFKDWLLMYAFVVTPIVYMVFGLSQMLPDTVLSWIGAGIRSLGETQATGEMRRAMESHNPALSLPAKGRRSSGGALPGNKPGSGPLPEYGGGSSPSPSGGGGGATSSYGTGTNSRASSSRSNRSSAPVNANPQGVVPTAARNTKDTQAQEDRVSALEQKFDKRDDE